jgi:vacuolar protein sorting-associated protein 54
LFDARLGHIDGAGNTGPYLMQLVEAKTVAQSEPESKQSEEKQDETETAKEEKPIEAS